MRADTLLFIAFAVLAISWLGIMVWYKSILHEMNKREEAALLDEDMRDEEDFTK